MWGGPGCYRCKYKDLKACSPLDVQFLELVKSSQHTSTSNTSKNVGTGSFHHGHETFILHNLDCTVNGAFVLNSTTRGHHHTSSDGVNRIGHKSSSNGNTPAKKEGQTNISTVTKEDGLESVKHAKVHATVDEDTNSRDSETSVQALDTIRFECLHIDINETIKLALTTFTLGIIGKPGSSIVKRVDKQKRHSTSSTTASNVGGKFPAIAGVFWTSKNSLDCILEGKVKSLCREVSEDIGQVSSPEGVNTLSLQYPLGAVNDTLVWFVKPSLLDHLILVLDKKFDSLNRSSSCLGYTSSNTSEHEVLKEPKLFCISHCAFLSWSLYKPREQSLSWSELYSPC